MSTSRLHAPCRHHPGRAVMAFVVAAAVAVLGAVVLAGCDGDTGEASPSPSSDPVVLLVDGRPVHRSAVDAVRAELRLGGESDAEEEAREEVVRRELVRREAERLGVAANGDELAARREVVADQFGGEQALAAALARVPMTEAQLQSGLKDGVLREAVQDTRFGDLSAGAAAARRYYKNNRSSFREEASAHLWSIQVAAERIAENALERLESGRPFEEVARQFSTDPESKAAGGDLGVIALSSLPEPLRRAVETTPEGTVSKPVQGPGGWYLLKATDLRTERVIPFAEARDEIVQELTRRKRFKALDDWLDSELESVAVTEP